MTRRSALKRLLVGVVFIPIYIVLFPISFAIAILVTVIDVGFTIVTGRQLTRGPNLGRRFWAGLGDGATWVLTGDARAKPR